jgi:hypothetical protein
MTDELPGNAEGVARPWPYAHTMIELDRCWDAYMEATVTEGHPLVGTFVPLAEAGVQPYHLSLIFDLALTVADQEFARTHADLLVDVFQRGKREGARTKAGDD